MSQLKSRTIFGLGAVASAGLMAVALYLQYFMELEPCPLCMVQRGFVILFGVLCLLAAIHGPGRRGNRIYAGAALLSCFGGAAAALRQIWLQTLPPDQLPSCLPSFDYMLEAFPMLDIVRLTLMGTADCAEVTWTLLGLGLAEWSLLSFIAGAGLSVWILVRRAA